MWKLATGTVTQKRPTDKIKKKSKKLKKKPKKKRVVGSVSESSESDESNWQGGPKAEERAVNNHLQELCRD